MRLGLLLGASPWVPTEHLESRREGFEALSAILDITVATVLVVNKETLRKGHQQPDIKMTGDQFTPVSDRFKALRPGILEI